MSQPAELKQCQHCKVEIEEGRFCNECVQYIVRSSREALDQQQRDKNLEKEDTLYNPVYRWEVLVLFAVGMLGIGTSAFFLFQPELGPLMAASRALMTVSLLYCMGAWFFMWLELLMEDFVIALFCLILPVGAYRLVYTYPERAMKPFIIHSAAGGVFILLNIFIPDIMPW